MNVDSCVYSRSDKYARNPCFHNIIHVSHWVFLCLVLATRLVSIEQVQFYIVEVASRLPVTRVLSVSKGQIGKTLSSPQTRGESGLWKIMITSGHLVYMQRRDQGADSPLSTGPVSLEKTSVVELGTSHAEHDVLESMFL